MAITMETNPHPLLSTEHELHVRRKVILPDNLIHRLEWRYFVRWEGRQRKSQVVERVGKRMRVGRTRHHGSHGGHLRQGQTSNQEADGDPQGPNPLHDALSIGHGYEGKTLLVSMPNHMHTNK